MQPHLNTESLMPWSLTFDTESVIHAVQCAVFMLSGLGRQSFPDRCCKMYRHSCDKIDMVIHSPKTMNSTCP